MKRILSNQFKSILCLSILFFLCFYTGNVFAQSTISGKVTGADNSPIIGANIYIEGTTTGTITGLDGSYSIELPKGGGTLVYQYIGYATKKNLIEADAKNQTLDVVMSIGGLGLDEVLVTASSTFRSQKEAPLSISSLKQKDITKLNANSQADILRSIPGITAEGGGGETATNLFVRGLPSGGQYVFNPLQYDGLPLMTTFGLNSSAHDVYARPDIGFKGVEFVRGGASILYGAGSAAGIINYVSKTGDTNPGNIINLEVADQGRLKTDFYSGGRLGGEGSKTFYAITGFMRYDDGPYDTGVPTRGGQVRANIKKNFDKGFFTLHTQMINDRAQFLMPLPLQGGTRERLDGNDGDPVSQLMTGELNSTSFLTAGGVYDSPYEDGVYTKGGYAMGEFENNLTSSLKFRAKAKLADYKHSFALYVGGNGANGGNPVALDEYVDIVAPGNTGYAANYHGLEGSVDGADLVVDNLHVDRIRPMTDYSGEASLTQKVKTSSGSHNITLGTFIGRSEADDINFQYRVVSEFNNNPKLVNISFTDSLGSNVVYSQAGIYNRIGQDSNNFLRQNKTAFYVTDEIIANDLRLDVGFRWERTTGDYSKGNLVETQVYDNPELSTGLANVQYADGSFIRSDVDASAWAVSLAGLYSLSASTNLYANFSKGFFFPQLRNFAPIATGVPGADYSPENIIQGEAGVKFGNNQLSASAAAYFVTLQDRIKITNSFVNGALQQVRREEQSTSTIGLEATGNYEIIDNLNLRASITYQNHEITKNETEDLLTGEVVDTLNVGNKLSRQPNLLGFAGLYYDDNNFDGFVTANLSGPKFTNDDNKIEMDGFGIVRLGLGYTLGLGNNDESFRLGLSVFNLLNSQGVTEGNPRALAAVETEDFFFGRPILPRRVFFTGTFNF